MESNIRNQIMEMILSTNKFLQPMLHDKVADKYIDRLILKDIDSMLEEFISHRRNRWLILSGLRGVGKTTLLNLICLKIQSRFKYFLSLERVALIKGNMIDVIHCLEEAIGSSLDDFKEPIYLLLDEVHYLSDWALAVKTIYDRNPNVFIITTGSSALKLQTNPDVARRSINMTLHPLSFNEYLSYKISAPNMKSLDSKIINNIFNTVFKSDGALEVFQNLKQLQPVVNDYYASMELNTPELRNDYLNNFIEFDSLPFVLEEHNNSHKTEIIYNILQLALSEDLNHIYEFNSITKSQMPQLLILLAQSNSVSLTKISNYLNLNIKTIYALLDALQKNSILSKIAPRGGSYHKVRKPNKYLFNTPAIRNILAIKGGLSNEQQLGQIKGYLFEDLIYMSFNRILNNLSMPILNLEYDYSELGADFIITNPFEIKDNIVIEVGWNKRQAIQTYNTLQRTKGRYGLVISNTKLFLDLDKKTVFMPLEYFLVL